MALLEAEAPSYSSPVDERTEAYALIAGGVEMHNRRGWYPVSRCPGEWSRDKTVDTSWFSEE